MKDYDPKEIEPKWQKKWADAHLYETPDELGGKENEYVLVEFAYPSGNLHVGHWYAFSVPDIYARYRRMQGKNVLFPMGFDAFGLPAENAAIKNKVNPREWTFSNIDFMRKQLHSMGATFDWTREVVTASPEYYKWTQWLFLQFLEKGLAYQSNTPVNWCPGCKTVLANEQVAAGECERCGSKVEKRDMLQWNIKITDYADRLIDDLEALDWPKPIKEAQKNWIGRSEGAEITFELVDVPGQKDGTHKVEVFTTRPDTIFGATFLAISPELAKKWMDVGWQAPEDVKKYVEKTIDERVAGDYEEKDKTGIQAGFSAINPATKEKIPVWVTNYVLGDVGTGAIMAVPAHDERDWDFAKKYNLEIKHVVAPYFSDPENPFKPDKKTVYRNVVHSIVVNPKNGKVLCLEWKDFPWNTFIIGGIENEESNVEAALREIKEETGYVNLKFVKKLAGPFVNEFYAAHKDINRVATVDLLLFELENEEQVTISEEEGSKHNIVWVDKSELRSFIKGICEKEYEIEALERGEEACFTGEGVLVNSPRYDFTEGSKARGEMANKFGKQTTTYKLRDWVVSRQRYWGCPIPVIHCPTCGTVPVPESELPVVLPDVDDYLPSDEGKSPLAKASDWVRVKCPKCSGDARRETDTLDTFIDSSWYFLRYTDPKNEKEFASKDILKKWMPVGFYSGGAEHTTMHLLYSRFFHKVLFDLGLVNEDEPYKRRMNRGLILGPDGQKMSKSRGNVIDPDKEVERLGADTVRMYLAFIGPYNEVGSYPWNPDAAVGVRRFLERVWNLQSKVSDNELADTALMHQTIKKVTEDVSSMKMNTGVSALMVFVSALTKQESVSKKEFQNLILLLAPYAPHIAEELWQTLGHKNSVHTQDWPKYDEEKILKEDVTLAVQIDGKVRANITLARDIGDDEVKERTLALPDVKKWLEDREAEKVIVVPGKIVSIVTKG